MDQASLAEDEDADDEDRPSYIFMEVKSKAAVDANVREIDIEKMIEKFSFDDFMKGMYTKNFTSDGQPAPSKTQAIMASLATGQGLDKFMQEQDQTGPSLQFQDPLEQSIGTESFEEVLRKTALNNLREKRKAAK